MNSLNGETEIECGWVESNIMWVIYILINKAMPGLIKIGYTNKTIKKRMKELSRHSGVTVPFYLLLYSWNENRDLQYKLKF